MEGSVQIDIRQGSVLDADTESIATAIGVDGVMRNPNPAAFRRVVGEEVESEIVPDGESLSAGQAVVSSGGISAFKSIIHVVVVPPAPELPLAAGVVMAATKTALQKAVESGVRSVALPGFGAGDPDSDPDQVANEMFAALRQCETLELDRVVLTDSNSEIVAAWTLCVDCL